MKIDILLGYFYIYTMEPVINLFPKICPEVLQAHMTKVKAIKILAAASDNPPLVKELAATYLEVLGSKAGNDILESVLVRASV